MKYIYGLLDPISNKIRYVGQTDNLTQRLQQHLQDTSNTPKVEWIKALKSTNTPPKMIVLSEVKDGENAHEIEYRWIYFGRQNGWPLTNTVAMKTQEYYSLQGYFERLIVEMEKPEGLPEKRYSWEDIKESLVKLFVQGLDNFPLIAGALSDALPSAFCFLSTLCFVLYAARALGENKGELSPVKFIFTLLVLFGGAAGLITAFIGERWGKLSVGVCLLGMWYLARIFIW